MSRRFQFSLRALLVLMLCVACYFAGIQFERERKRREAARIPSAPEFKLSREAAALKYAGADKGDRSNC
jgi:hypothetical protein